MSREAPAKRLAYTYDAAGNRITAKRGGNVASSQTLTYNTVGQIISDGYAYDGVGDMVKALGQTFTYNGAQQMTSSTKDGVTTRYEYAGGDMNKLLSQATDGEPSTTTRMALPTPMVSP
ncbi:hypothetical protein [Curtobacterium sp. MCLR17_042]|uniref:hypothetical protein n=1 Tax=Curtobacterium sp. MCLR17_042 TaxID=2175626 RepID=UPI000DA737CA|nr:hypothetical protein [Curtobacterium sp. MCLR17_042]PZE29152.1 hypothetical protein DEJ02_07235 [Curtobacterium sp. MCLR17_042]